MRKLMKFFVVFVCNFFIVQCIYAQPLSGTFTIGPAPSNYTTIQAACSTVAARGVNGAVILEVKSNYVPENITIIVDSVPGASATNTITLRPQSGAGVINLLNTSTVIRLNRVDFFTIDGRPGGVGTSRNFFLRSTSSGAPVVHTLQGDVTNFTLRNCVLLANNTNFTNGMVNMEPFSVTNGHDNWTITNNEFLGNGDNGSGTNIGSNVGVYVTGSPNSWSNNNDLVITNNIFKDFFSPTNAMNPHFPISLSTNTRGVTVTGNSIFFTITPTYQFTNASASVAAIRVGSSISEVTIENNVIGGSNITGGGSATTLRGKFVFRGIDAFVPANETIRIINNRIVNLDLSHDTAASGSSMFIGINVSGSGSSIIEDNTIGSITNANNILINNNTVTVNNYLVVGINAANTGSIGIDNNKIGGIASTSTNTNLYANFYGINYSGATLGTSVNISNNTIGSTDVSNSILINHGSNTTQYNVRGINAATSSTATVPTVTIDNNTIANISYAPSVTNTGATMNGIYANPQNASTTTYNITRNKIFHLNTVSDRNNTSTSIALTGITLFNSTGSAHTTTPLVSQNTIYGLTNRSTTALNTSTPPYLTGIIFTNGSSSSARVICERNTIHSLNTTVTNTGSLAPVICGIQNNSVALLVRNNIIRLGIDSLGNSLSNAVEVRGYLKNVSQPSTFTHNTVFIGGLNVLNGTNANSSAYYRATTSTLDTVANNILINKRSNVNTSGGGIHRVVYFNSSTLSYIAYNIYFNNGIGGVVGTVNGGVANLLDFTTWKNALTADVFSGFNDVSFVNATGNNANINFIPSSANGLFSVKLSSVENDFNNLTRDASYATTGAFELTSKIGVWKADAATTSWTTATNWVSNSVPSPTGGISIYIPSNTVNIPVLSTTVILGRLVNATNQNLTINNGVTITLRGELVQSSSTSVVNGNGATLQFSGTQHQTMGGIININNLIIDNSNGVGITGGTVNLKGTLTSINGVLNSGGNLILKSDATGTARVAAASSSGGYISGNVVVERYIPGGNRRFRFLGHPFNAGMPLNELTDDIDVTGAISGSNANNFTATATNAPSAFSFNELLANGNSNDGGWVPYISSSSTSSIPAGSGIRILVRGTKGQTGSLTGGAYTPDPVTIDMTGALRQGDFNQLIDFSDINKGWNLISNPYASNIDWTTVTKNNVNNAVYVYKPSGNVYASWINGSSTNGGSNIIESGNAFFVRTNAANPSLGWHEADKVSTTQPTTMFRSQNTIHNRVSLILKNETTKVEDEVIIRFGDDPATDLFDRQFDAQNIAASAHDLYVQDNNQLQYSIFHGTELASWQTENREVKLGFTVQNIGDYSIKATTLNAFTKGNTIWLKDSFTNSLVKIEENTNYSFTVTTDEASKNKNRFSLIFNPIEKVTTTITSMSLNISPNPAKSKIQISFSQPEPLPTNITITDVLGRKVKVKQLGKVQYGIETISINDLAPGLYIVHYNNGIELKTEKLIIN